MSSNADPTPHDPSLRLRFEIPRTELERAEAADLPPGAAFDETHLYGRVRMEINAPLAPDPILQFLREKRGLKAEPPITVVLDQPVAYVVGQLASAAVLALHEEGEFTIPLAGGRGAISVAYRNGALDLGVPLEQYAGVVSLPPEGAAAALGSACEALAAILRSSASLSRQPVTGFLQREARILDALARKPRADPEAPPRTEPGEVWPVERFATTGAPALASLSAEAERRGAHVVPYWRAGPTHLEGQVAFEPIRVAPRAALRGALARFIFPGAERRLDAAIEGDAEGTRHLRERLKRPVAFSASVSNGRLSAMEEPGGALPVA